MARGLALHGAALALLLGGCTQPGLGDAQALPDLDQAAFRCDVQPILTKSCAAFACHGDARRYFHVFARNRLRLAGTEADRNAPLSDAERATNFDAARAFVNAGAPDQSFLLLKPLDTGAGGYFHRGALLFGGGNVFLSRDDPDFKVLEAWTQGKKENASCVEPGSTL